MRILFLSNSIGGLLNFRYELLVALINRGDEVILSSQIEPNSTPEPLEKIGCKFIPLKMNQRGTNPLEEFKLIGEYKRLIREVNPQIVMAYTIKPNIYGSVACRKLGIPIIANITGLGMALEGKGILQRISVLLYRWGFKRTDFVFFQNQESIDFFSRNSIRPKAHSIIAGSGVNLEKFALAEYPEENGQVNFLFVGRILEGKGIAQLIDAAKYCKNHHPNVTFHIVGIKDDPYYSGLIEEMDSSGLLRYHGKQSDVRPFVKMAHCLVHPSFYPEGLSNVCLESSAMGRPVITTDKSGCRETVDDGITGYIVKQRDSQDLIDKIERFLKLTYEEKRTMGLRAHQKVAKEFNRADVVNRYIEEIDRLTNMKKIAIIGTVGVPANYGGFESLVENIIGKNASKDIEYTVFCSGKSYEDRLESYKGAKLKYVNLKANGAQSTLYDIISMLKTSNEYDVALVLGVSGCIFLPIFRHFFKNRLIVNIDGLEHRREKWGRLAKWFLRKSESMAVKYADVIVADNKGIQDYVAETYQKESALIAYGGDHVERKISEERTQEVLRQYGVEKGNYAISVCRIEPENNCHIILEAFATSHKRLIYIGNWERSEYGKWLKARYSKYSNITIHSPEYDLDTLYVLRSHAALYVHGHSAGGTNPSLVEAMFFGKPIIAYDVIYNRSTTGNQAYYFSCTDDLVMLLDTAGMNGEVMRQLAQEKYTWKKIASQYESLYD